LSRKLYLSETGAMKTARRPRLPTRPITKSIREFGL
jgi:hypothetical protein